MHLDALSITHNYLNINIKLAQIIGLTNAAYVSVALDALYQAKKKNKIDADGFFKLDRKYVFRQTTLSTAEQKQCEKELETLGLVLRNENKTDSIAFDVGAVYSLITTDDEKVLDEAKTKLGQIQKVDKELAKKDALIVYFKKLIKEVDFDVREALYNWVEAIDGKCNKQTILMFEEDLNKYTQNKKDKLAIIKLATINGWREASWAINRFERDGKQLVQNNTISNTSGKKAGENVATSLADIDLTRTF